MTIQVGGLVYELDEINKTATVNSLSDYNTTDDIYIPSTITYNSIIYTVDSIRDEAFMDNTTIKKIRMQYYVTSVGKKAFFNSHIEYISFANYVSIIGESACEDCQYLNTIFILNGPNKLSIGTNAFANTGLTSITIPSSVTSIGNYAFDSCTNLTSVTISDAGTLTIGTNAFANTGLTSITIPSSVTSIDNSAFATVEYAYIKGDDTNYTTPFGTSTTVFYDKNNTPSQSYTKSVAFNPSPTVETSTGSLVISNFCDANTIDLFGMFSGSSGTTGSTGSTGSTGTVEEFTSTFVGVNTFQINIYSGTFTLTISIDTIILVSKTVNVPILVYQLDEINNTATVTKYNGTGGNVIIPSSINVNSINYTVVSIGTYAFKGKGLTSITIPNSITSIGNNAFDSCTSLTSATIGEGVVTIGTSVFQNSGLKSITIPNSVTSIGNKAFYNCTSLTSATIGEGAVTMGTSVFQNSGLKSITIPKSVTSIGSSAFDSCTSLTSATIKNGVVTIGTSSFRSSGLTSITIPKSVTSIRDYAFYGCASLKDVTIEDGGTVTIGIYAFAALETTNQIYSNALTSIIIPNSVTSIGNYAFNYCKNLTTVTIDRGVVTIGDYAFQNNGLKTITIPNSVTKIGSSAFSFCRNLTSVNIIDGGTVSIQPSAFSSTGLTSITIPKSVTSIGTGAFYDCASLTSVTIEDGGALIIYGNAFKNTGLISITIPKSVTSISSGAFLTVKYAYIQGNDEKYTTPFNTSTTVYYDKDSEITKTYPQKSLFETIFTVEVITGGLLISPLFDFNPNTLLAELKYFDEEENGSLSNGKIESKFVGVTFFPVYISGKFKLTINLGNIIFVEDKEVIIPDSLLVSSQLGITNSYTVNNKKEFRILKKLLPKYSGILVPIEKMDRTIFTSVHPTYESIETIVGYSSNLNFAKLDELAKLGPKNLVIFTTGQYPLFVGNVAFTSNGTDTFASGVLVQLGECIEIPAPNGDKFKICLVLNGSSGITIEKIETIETSPICFPAGTPILTDQGYIPIDQITTQTLHNKPIQLTKTISTDKYLVCFEKDSLEKNVPFQRTIMSKDHMVYYKEYTLKAKDMIPYFDKVYKIKYTGEVLYNVLVNVHSKMKVNNMICETLDPKHKMAKLYNRTTKEKEDMIVVWKEEKRNRTQMKFK